MLKFVSIYFNTHLAAEVLIAILESVVCICIVLSLKVGRINSKHIRNNLFNLIIFNLLLLLFFWYGWFNWVRLLFLFIILTIILLKLVFPVLLVKADCKLGLVLHRWFWFRSLVTHTISVRRHRDSRITAWLRLWKHQHVKVIFRLVREIGLGVHVLHMCRRPVIV